MAAINRTTISFDCFSRISIHYVNEQSPNWDNYDGFTISLSYNANGKKEKWNDFGVFSVADLNMKLENYATRYLTIVTDIKNNNKNSVIKTIKYNENDEIYCIIFNGSINNINKNWHEKLYTAFVRYPLFSSTENININTKVHKPSKTEKQLTQLYNGMFRLRGLGRNVNYNPFEETLEMKARKISRITKQIIDETTHLAQQLQQFKTMKTVDLKQGGKNKYNLKSVKNISNKKTQNVEIAINQCNVIIKQNMAIIINQNENVLENVFLEELENECERITITIQERENQINRTTSVIDFANIDYIATQAQEMIQYDWKKYNVNIFKQWQSQMIEQSESNQRFNSQTILWNVKESIVIGAGFNGSLFSTCKNVADAECDISENTMINYDKCLRDMGKAVVHIDAGLSGSEAIGRMADKNGKNAIKVLNLINDAINDENCLMKILGKCDYSFIKIRKFLGMSIFSIDDGG